MALLELLFASASLPYTILLGIALGFALLQTTGVLGLLAGGGDHDHDGSTDADAHVDADADADADADGDADGESDGHGGPLSGLGAALGVGRVPLSIIGLCFSLVFSLVGLAVNATLRGRLGALPTVTLAGSLPVSAVVAFLVTRSLSGALGRLVADPAQEASTLRDLVGQTAIVISSRVDRTFGEVRLRDKSGHVVRVVCELHEDEPAVPEGKEVVVVDVDDARKRLLVSSLDAEGGKHHAGRREQNP